MIAALKSARTLAKWMDSQLSRFKAHPNRNAIECAILFVAGFSEDFILSFDTIVTANKLWHYAGATSWLIVIMQFAVFRNIMDDRITAWRKIMSLAFGCALGAMVAVGISP